MSDNRNESQEKETSRSEASGNDAAPEITEHSQAQQYSKLGMEYFEKRDLDKAEEYLKKALELHVKHGDLLAAASSYGNLGNVYLGQGKWKEAGEHLHKALELHTRLGNSLGMASAYGNLGILAKKQEHYKEAFPLLTIGFLIVDSLEGAEPVKRIISNQLAALRENVGEEQFLVWLEEFEAKHQEQNGGVHRN